MVFIVDFILDIGAEKFQFGLSPVLAGVVFLEEGHIAEQFILIELLLHRFEVEFIQSNSLDFSTQTYEVVVGFRP